MSDAAIAMTAATISTDGPDAGDDGRDPHQVSPSRPTVPETEIPEHLKAVPRPPMRKVWK